MKVDDINDKPPHHIETFTEGEGGGGAERIGGFLSRSFQRCGMSSRASRLLSSNLT